MSLSCTRSAAFDRIKVRELKLPLLRLAVKFREDANLDRTRLRENVIFVQQIFVAVGEIDDGYAHHAVEVAINLENRFLELRP